MKKIILGIFVILCTLSYSQEPFRYDTIRVSKDDTRNIHHYNQNQNLSQQNQQRSIGSTQSLPKKQFNAKNLRYGLNLGLNFSNHYTLFRVAPQVGYQFNKYIMMGVGVSYYYSKLKGLIKSDRVTHYNNSIGANVFGYLYPTSFFAISLQPEVNYIWVSSKDAQGVFNKRDVIVPSVVLGAGIRLGRAHAMLYYDLVQDVDSPYTSGIFYGVSLYF